MQNDDEKFTSSDWLRWGIATILAAVTMSITMMTWAYGTFTPKDVFQIVNQRLDRIEDKIDELLKIRHR